MANARWSLKRWPWLWAGALLTACSSGASHTDGNGGTEAQGITVTITTPKANADASAPLVTGLLNLQGTLSYDAGIVPGHSATVEVLGTDGTTRSCTVVDDHFICPFDTAVTAAGKPIIGCNQAVTLRVRANGKLNGAEVLGAGDVDVVVDNCLPTVTFHSPDEGAPFIGTATIDVEIKDSALVEAHVVVTDPQGKSVLPQPLDAPADVDLWHPHVVLDRSGANATEDLKITVTATDAVGLTTEVVRTVTAVKKPFFLGSDQDLDHFNPGTDVDGKPLDLEVRDFALGANLVAFHDEPPLANDNLMDAVVGTTNGLVVRAGLPVRDAAGQPVGAPNFQPSGQFDNPTLDAQFKALRVVQDKKGVAIARVFLQDLDDDGDLDILAVGTDWNYAGVAWAVLNVTKQLPSGATVRAFKLAATQKLPAPPLSAALGDLNGDGVPDLLVGASQPDIGLMTLLVQKAPMCALTDGSADKLCAQVTDFNQLKSAQIFAANANAALHKGVTGISSIAVADFYQDDANLNDVCVGEASRGIVSCYRNVTHDGSLAQAQDSYTFNDAADTHHIVNAEFSSAGGGGPDLIVQSTTGHFVRWLTGDHNGGFKFVENNVPTRNVYGLGCSTLGTAQVGPLGLGGAPYLTAISDTRKVTILPTQLNDKSHVLQCFRAWVLGGQLMKVDAADLNNDGAPDLVALDAATPGLAVAFGQLDSNGLFNGNFIAPDAHHMCAQARDPHGYGVFDIAEAVVADVTNDQRLDLTLFSTQGGTLSGQTCPETSKILAPAWTVEVFANTADGVVDPQPRQGEFAPYADLTAGRRACDEVGTVQLARAGDLDGDGVADLVTVRQGAPYFIGDDTNQCGCGFNETREIDSQFGPDCPSPGSPLPGCPPASAFDCRNFSPDLPCHETPLVGYGGGAPLLRASGNVFLSGAGAPFGLTTACTVGNPCHVIPTYAFAAGVEPQGLVLADLNHDGKLDVATAMEALDEPCVGDNTRYLAARVRVFQGDGTGKFSSAPFGSPQDELVLKKCGASSSTPSAYPVSYRKMPDGITGLQTGIWPNPSTGKFDTALFALGQKNGQLSWLAHTLGFNFEPAKSFALGADVKAFAVRDVNVDPQMQVDVLALLGLDLTYLPGAVLADGKTGFFDTKVTLAETAQTADWLDAGDVNGDGYQDFVLLNKQEATLDVWLGIGRSPTPLSTQFVRFPGKLRAAMEARDTDLADMDGDGCLDIVVRSRRAVTVLHNEGVGCSGAMIKH